MDNLYVTPRLLPLLFLASSALSMVVAMFAARYRQGQVWRYVVYATATIALWCFSDAMFFLEATDDARRWIWLVVSYCAQVACVPIVFSYALYFAGFDHWPVPWLNVLLWAPFLLAIILAVTNPWHSLVWDATLPPLDFKSGPGHGPYFFFMLPVCYGLMLVALAIFVQSIWRLHAFYQQQVILLLVAALLPLAASILYFTPYNPWPGVDLAPAAFAVTGLLLLVSLNRYHLIELRPIYRDAVFEHMSEGAIILDGTGRIADINPVAQYFLAASGRSIGDSGQAALASCFALHGELDLSPGAHHLVLTREQLPRHFDLRIAAIGDRTEASLLVWRDITRLRLALATIDAQEHFLAARAEAEAGLAHEIGHAVSMLQAQIQTALDHLEFGR